jgi:hypothetical protein
MGTIAINRDLNEFGNGFIFYLPTYAHQRGGGNELLVRWQCIMAIALATNTDLIVANPIRSLTYGGWRKVARLAR